MSDDNKVNWHPPLKYTPTPPSISDFGFIDKKTRESIFSFSASIPNDSANQSKTAEDLYIAWSKVVPGLSQSFFNELDKLSSKLGCTTEDLAAIIFKESGFNPKATNGINVGLIQMDESALKNAVKFAYKKYGDDCGLKKNITFNEYKNLSANEQLKYAEAYLNFRIDDKGLHGKKLSGAECWTLIKRPGSINNKNFVNKLQKTIDSTKKIPFK